MCKRTRRRAKVLTSSKRKFISSALSRLFNSSAAYDAAEIRARLRIASLTIRAVLRFEIFSKSSNKPSGLMSGRCCSTAAINSRCRCRKRRRLRRMCRRISMSCSSGAINFLSRRRQLLLLLRGFVQVGVILFVEDFFRFLLIEAASFGFLRRRFFSVFAVTFGGCII